MSLDHSGDHLNTHDTPLSLYREDYKTSFRHFTAAGYEHINALIESITAGRESSVNEFIRVIQPWIRRVCLSSEMKTLGHTCHDSEKIENMVTDALLDVIRITRSGKMQRWSDFEMHFLQKVHWQRKKYQLRKTRNAASMVTIDADVANPHTNRNSQMEDKYASGEPETVPLHETLPSRDLDADKTKQSFLTELRRKIEETFDLLEPRQAEILRMYLGFGSHETRHTLKEISEEFGVTIDRIRQIRDRALRTLRDQVATQHLADFLNG